MSGTEETQKSKKYLDAKDYDYMDDKGNIYKFVAPNYMLNEVVLEDIHGKTVSLSINEVKPIPGR